LKLVKENYNLKIIEEKQFLDRDVIVIGLEPNHGDPHSQSTIDKRKSSYLAYKHVAPNRETLVEGAYPKIRKILQKVNPRAIKKLELLTEKGNFINGSLPPPHLPKAFTLVKITNSSIGQDKIPALRISFFDVLNIFILHFILDDSKLEKDSQSV